MARGWESKNIESQQEEALSARAKKPALSAEARERLDRERAIELALAAKRSELAHASGEAHRSYLSRVISDLERSLTDLRRS